MKISFTLNNKYYEVEDNPVRRLLDVLRDDYGLTGVKEGCGEGECGACTVIIDGKAVNSCIIPFGNANGTTITTIEGFRETERFKIIQESFEEAGAVQCGFCIPGMVMTTEALLNVNPTPNEEEIRTALSGNLCRCTGYDMIVDAVMLCIEKNSKLEEKLW